MAASVLLKEFLDLIDHLAVWFYTRSCTKNGEKIFKSNILNVTHFLFIMIYNTPSLDPKLLLFNCIIHIDLLLQLLDYCQSQI